MWIPFTHAESGPTAHPHLCHLCAMNTAGPSMLIRRGTGVAAARLARPLTTASTRSAREHFARYPAPGHRGLSASPSACIRCLSTAPGRGGELRNTSDSGTPATRSAEGGIELRHPKLGEKWGWSETAHRWYLPLKALGVFSAKNTNALSSGRMLQTCLNNAERKEWYSDGKISNEFLPKLLWISTNIWLISRRLLREGERGKKVQEMLFDELWRETKRQMRSIEVSEMMLKKYLSEAQQHTFVTLVQYDHAYTLDTPEEQLKSLTSALWRGIYMTDESIKEPHVRVMAEYVHAELAGMYELDSEDFFACCMEFAPPPPELKMVEKSLQESTKRGRKGKKNAAVNTPEVSTGSDEPNGVVVERVAHGDLGDEKQGRWRASLAESGKVYYWHTGTREVTWEKPAESDAFVPSVMPKAEATAAATATA